MDKPIYVRHVATKEVIGALTEYWARSNCIGFSRATDEAWVDVARQDGELKRYLRRYLELVPEEKPVEWERVPMQVSLCSTTQGGGVCFSVVIASENLYKKFWLDVPTGWQYVSDPEGRLELQRRKG